MTDDPTVHGLGMIPSPPDARDWPVELAYATLGVDVPLALPASFTVAKPVPSTMDQGATGRCVAFGSAWLKRFQDLRDTGDFSADTLDFFRSIGGSDTAGAVPRIALQQLLDHGYPEAGNANAARHRIASYYSIPTTVAAVKAALVALQGPVGLGVSWFNSWFRPRADGTLPPPDTFAGGHWIVCAGYDDARGALLLQNSWGASWGVDGGRCWMPYGYMTNVNEAWRALDVIDPKPVPRHYRIAIAAHALVRQAVLSTPTVTSATRITGWQDQRWGATASGAPCGAPRVIRGAVSGQATVVPVTAGAFAHKWVRIGGGVSLISSSAAQAAEMDPEGA